jgi:hypothetical protein
MIPNLKSTFRLPGLLKVDPEQRFFMLPSKVGFGAAEWVNSKTWKSTFPLARYQMVIS